MLNHESTSNTWPADIDDEGILTIPDELWQLLGWKEGDELEFIDQEDGSILLVKRDETNDDSTTVDS